MTVTPDAPASVHPGTSLPPLWRAGILLLAIGVPVVVLFAGAEIYLRATGHFTYNRTYPGLHRDGPAVEWVRHDPELGWVGDPDFLPGEINPQGFRDPADYDSLYAPSGKRRVMIVGDSFVYGAGVAAESTFPSQLRATLSTTHDVFAIGVPGWGLDQMYLAYRRYAPTLSPDVVVLAFIDDDIDRVLEAFRRWERLNKPSFEVVDGELVPQRVPGRVRRRIEKWIGRSVLLSTVLREYYVMSNARPVVAHMVGEMARDVRDRGGRFAALRIPTGDHPYASRRIRRWLIDYDGMFADLGVPYHDASDTLLSVPNWGARIYVEDGHLNEYGNELVAAFVLDRVIRPES
ncbi:MAG TPA: hypothetical protein VF190_15255 [Rhodothermales bacterium]